MTRSRAEELERRRGPGRPAQPKTLAASIYVATSRALLESEPSERERWEEKLAVWRADPVRYAVERLGVRPWHRAAELLRAIAAHRRVSVRSGHKVAKSHTATIAAWWFFECFDSARVVMSAPTSRQVDQILWRELRMLRARAPETIEPTIQMPELARSGFRSADFREIVGFTAREAEAVAGISGKNLLYLLDESSGIGEEIFEAIEGNRAGGARVVLFGNPTRTEGEHFESFHGKREFYVTFTISSEETPNALEGRDVIPGLATKEWIDEKRREWGEKSALYRIRVKGEHVLAETGKIVSVAAISAAELAWHDMEGEGRLCLGVDPAGDGEQGDEHVIAPRRGQKILELEAAAGLSKDALLVRVLSAISRHRKPSDTERPLVVLDREGKIGAEVFYHFKAHEEKHPDAFELLGVRGSNPNPRQPMIYDRQRDELFGNFADWLREGGAIPEDSRLAKELHAATWSTTSSGKLKATPKRELRAMLGRSPDRMDACQLAVWEPLSARVEELAGGAPARARTRERSSTFEPDFEPEATIDPYGGIDPYGAD